MHIICTCTHIGTEKISGWTGIPSWFIEFYFPLFEAVGLLFIFIDLKAMLKTFMIVRFSFTVKGKVQYNISN